MNIIRPNWSVPENIHAISTTRLSINTPEHRPEPSVFDYCNLGAHVGDDAESVKVNRKTLIDEYKIPSTPVWLDQTHSVELVNLTNTPTENSSDSVLVESNLFENDGSLVKADGSFFKADGSITHETEVVCAVMTADCLPLLLCDDQGTQVAAVHVGWRGMADGIIENAIGKFDCRAENIIAWAGPCIGPNKFEIGFEVKQQLGGLSSHYQESSDGKVLANLYAICGFKLSEMGVRNYSHSSACTYSDERRFYSYRRDGQCGRMASLIWKGEPI